MSRFFHNRNLSSDYPEDSLKNNSRFQSIRDITASTKFLVATTPLSAYNEQLPPCLATGNRFFFNIKSSESPKLKKNYRSAQASRLVHTSQDNHRPSTAPACWEIAERIESCEIRCQQSVEISINDKIKLWKNCCTDILPVFKKENNELGSSLSRLTKGIFNLLGDASEEFNGKVNRKIDEIQQLTEEIKNLMQTVSRLQSEAKRNQEIKIAEDLIIKNEVDEMFGNDEEEIKALQLRTKRLLELKPSGVVGYLQEIYNSLSKERFIPEYTDFDIDTPNPDDISMALRYNYHLILQSTAKKVMSLLKKEFQQFDKNTQTQIPCVSSVEYEEILKKFEKNQLSLQSAQMQIDKLREDLISKQQQVEKSEKDKNHAHHEMLKCKRECDSASKELSSLRKDFESISSEFQTTKKELEVKTKECLRQEQRLQAQASKIKRLSAVPSLDMSDIDAESQGGLDPHSSFDRGFSGSNLEIPKRSPRDRDSTSVNRPRQAIRTATNVVNAAGSLMQRSSLYASSGGNKSNSSSSASFEVAENERRIGKELYPGAKILGRGHQEKEESLVKMPTIHEDGPPDSNFEEGYRRKSTLRYDEKGVSSTKPEKKIKKKKSDTSYLSRSSTMKDEKAKDKNKNKEKKVKDKKDTTDTMVQQDSFIGGEENKREVFRDGRAVQLVDRATNTASIIKAQVSIALQFNWECPDQEEKKVEDNDSGIYMLHFNPNNVYGLKGDVFYNSRGRVFSAQPRNSELSVHLFFQLK